MKKKKKKEKKKRRERSSQVEKKEREREENIQVTLKKNLGGHYGNNTMRHFSLMSFPPNLGGKNLCARERKFSSKFFTLPSFPLLPKSGKSTFSFLCFSSLLKSTQLNTVQGLKVYFSKKSHTCLPQVNPIAVSLFLSLFQNSKPVLPPLNRKSNK